MFFEKIFFRLYDVVSQFKIYNLIEKVIDLIYPRRCGFCNQRIKEDYTCKKCKKNLEYICIKESIKNTSLDYFDFCVCAYSYEGLVREKILAFKFKNKKYLYRSLSERLIEILQQYQKIIDVIICVPISWKRYIERGYNQSDLLAKWIAFKLKKQRLKFVLLKRKNNLKQSTLSQSERIINVMGSYYVLQKEKIQGKIILLVDDILTTGATVNECSKVLKENGAKEIIVATVAKSKIRKFIK